MNVLIIGLGSIAKKHLAAIRKIRPGAKVYALRSQNNKREKNEDVISIYNLEQLADTLIDFIIVSNPTSLHVDTIKSVLQMKRPLFIEKPLAHLSAGIPELIQQIYRHQIKTYIACNLRFHPLLRFIKKSLNSWGRINEVNIYCGSDLRTWRKEDNFKESYSAHPELGGGVHLDLIHEIDYTYWFFGMPKSSERRVSSKSSLAIKSFDYANFFLSYPTFNVNIVLNYYRTSAKRQIEIISENDVWTGDLLVGKLIDGRENIIHDSGTYSIADTYLDQMKYFIENLSDKSAYINSIEEAFEILQISLNEHTR